MKQIEETGDFRHSSGIKNIKTKTKRKLKNTPSSIYFIFGAQKSETNEGDETKGGGDSILLKLIISTGKERLTLSRV